MPGRLVDHDPDDDGWDPDEDDSSDWGSNDGEEDATVPCPHCRRPMYEDAPRCPSCGRYVSREDAPPSRKPWWIVLGVGLGLYVMWIWVFG